MFYDVEYEFTTNGKNSRGQSQVFTTDVSLISMLIQNTIDSLFPTSRNVVTNIVNIAVAEKI